MMSRSGFRSRTANSFFAALLVAATAAPILVSGIRGPGKYNGVVFYDNWDKCYLFQFGARIQLANWPGGQKPQKQCE
jgi:hypothetical protein